MKVNWNDTGDEQRLVELVATTSDAKQRDRYRVVLIAGRGLGDRPELHRERIAQAVGRSRQFVDQWVGRYRKAGIDALAPKRQPGAARRLTAGQEAELCAMLEAGPAPDEGIAAYNGPILGGPQAGRGRRLACGLPGARAHHLGLRGYSAARELNGIRISACLCCRKGRGPRKHCSRGSLLTGRATTFRNR